MTDAEKIAMLEEMMDLDGGTLTPQTQLGKLAEWDSLAAILLMVLLEDQFDRKIKGSQIKEFKTVADILNMMVPEHN